MTKAWTVIVKMEPDATQESLRHGGEENKSVIKQEVVVEEPKITAYPKTKLEEN